ncbi:MAG TPA: preprotein translocase subunit SecG [Allosphingosinicella sp.]|nr:preprotein translocase subunit SecG [Allosphingosinicella sp.]
MSGLFTFVLIVQALVALGLITLILMQRSEGGGLAGGGSPAGMMSARGASDFLTRGTSILATIFICLSILLAGLAAGQRAGDGVDASLRTKAPASAPARPAGTAPATPAAPAPAPAGNTSRVPGQ